VGVSQAGWKDKVDEGLDGENELDCRIAPRPKGWDREGRPCDCLEAMPLLSPE